MPGEPGPPTRAARRRAPPADAALPPAPARLPPSQAARRCSAITLTVLATRLAPLHHPPTPRPCSRAPEVASTAAAPRWRPPPAPTWPPRRAARRSGRCAPQAAGRRSAPARGPSPAWCPPRCSRTASTRCAPRTGEGLPVRAAGRSGLQLPACLPEATPCGGHLTAGAAGERAARCAATAPTPAGSSVQVAGARCR